MKLIIGGTASGKYEYVLSCGYSPKDLTTNLNSRVLYKLNGLVRDLMNTGTDNPYEIYDIVKSAAPEVIVADETGCGIIAVDAFERAYTEVLGRVLCRLASAADSVERVYYGIAQRIK